MRFQSFSPRGYLLFGMGMLWAVFIFATSCTVVTPDAWFKWFRENVFDNESAFERFQIFWAASWYFIVKGWHVTEFAVLMTFSTKAIDRWNGESLRNNVLWAGLICLIFAVSDEWHQTFVPKRGGLVSDAMIDALGILIVGFVFLRSRKEDVLPTPD